MGMAVAVAVGVAFDVAVGMVTIGMADGHDRRHGRGRAVATRLLNQKFRNQHTLISN